jgi:pimeloyl-ACP methyl ester carboxylesterase
MKKQFKSHRSISACIITFWFCSIAMLSFGQVSPVVKNIVIVHGAFTDASGWEAVYKILTKDGYHVILVQNPLTSLDDDVAATTRALDKHDGPVVLVGHSWAGSVITQAGLSPKVASLVYVAAFVPDAGESSLSVIQSAPALPKNGILPPDAKGFVYFDKALFHECFAADLPYAKTRFMFDSQQPIVGSCFAAVLTGAAWKTKPTYAIVATQDKAINPVLEQSMYKRAGAVVTEVKGSHVIFISQPQAVAAVIVAPTNPGGFSAAVGSMLKSSPTEIDLQVNDQTLSIKIKDSFVIYATSPGSLDSVSSASYVGVASKKQPDGSDQAIQVLIFPAELRGLNEGSFMLGGDQDAKGGRMTNGSASRMTNGSASPMSNGSVQKTDGTSLTVQYQGYSRTVNVPPNTPVVAYRITDRKLTPGDKVLALVKKNEDGTYEASKILFL